MKRLSRYELIGIGASVVVVILILIAVRFFPFSDTGKKSVTTDTDRSEVIVVDPKATNKEGALAQAIIDGSNDRGEVTKLIVDDVSIGNGREVKIGDTVTVHYIGVLKDGPQFDNSYGKGTPTSFKVGTGEVIEGWEQGAIGMKEGGKRILVVPPSLGYGNTEVNSLPPNATLLFSIELLSIE